uniref:Uncharacterized protein n=1 Tax=Chenopodium quinoa TaxID=63459 RepID=A0A803MP49_CHEQI
MGFGALFNVVGSNKSQQAEGIHEVMVDDLDEQVTQPEEPKEEVYSNYCANLDHVVRNVNGFICNGPHVVLDTLLNVNVNGSNYRWSNFANANGGDFAYVNESAIASSGQINNTMDNFGQPNDGLPNVGFENDDAPEPIRPIDVANPTTPFQENPVGIEHTHFRYGGYYEKLSVCGLIVSAKGNVSDQ